MENIKNIYAFILNLIMNLILMFLSYIVPKNNNLYIFGGNGGNTFSGNSKALFLYYKNKGKKVYYISNKEINNIDNELKKYFIKINNIKNIIIYLRAKYIFIDGMLWEIVPIKFILGRFNIINLWHGEPIKKIILSDPNYFKSMIKMKTFLYVSFYFKKLKISFTGNKNSKKNLQDAFENNFKITGLARNEIFFDKSGIYEINDIKKQLELYKYTKIILYTPTWRDNRDSFSPFSNDFLDKLNIELINNNYIFLVKGHLGTKNIDFSTKSNIKNISNIDIDIQEILKQTDILITDYSSIYIDFLLTKKPIIFYAFDIDRYLSEDRKMYYKYKNVIINKTLILKENKIIDSILNIEKIEKNKNYITEYKKLLNFFHKYQNGGYCSRIENELYKIENNLSKTKN